MPLFYKKKKQSEDSRKRLEYQLCLSKEAGADDILDISNCELTEVPSSALSICKVLQKKVFILHGNELRSLLPKGCSISSLETIKVLDLHENKLTSLPDDIGQLSALQVILWSVKLCVTVFAVLNAEHNQIKTLPESIGNLHNLSLRTLDLSENSIRELPKELANVRTLESLTLDASTMNYPPVSVCTAGTEEIQRYLCSELGVEYCPPSQYLLPVLENDSSKQSNDCVDGEVMAWQVRFQHCISSMAVCVYQEQERVEKDVCQQQKTQEAERQRVLEKVRQAETSISTRISNLLLDNKRMETMDKKFEQVLSLQQLDKSKAICQILQEEEMQKAAFEALQLQRDSVHGYIRNQIKLIEAELMQLTKLEVKRKNLDAENLQEVLAEQREALSDMLQQLLKQKDQREVELKHILMEMELKSDSTQQNYWMIQYQRLLDAKPLSLRMQEAGVDKDLVSLLCKLSAQHYLPILAHHRITAEALRHMTTRDLSKVGSPKKLHEEREAGAVLPTAPLQEQLTPPLTPKTPLTPTVPSPMDGPSSSECVVCMEAESQVIYLPCGHVCCCQVCSDALYSCPLCRSDISQRIRLYHG
uniref:RING-type domain-containing protein n=1 Tax=Astyanax mexicanus TaxID=7994 RepID=A0A8B9KH58_ASTMX